MREVGKALVQYASSSVAVCLFTMVAACSDAGRTGIGPGERAPDIKGSDGAGKVVSLRQLQGKVTLVNFWATWCGPCIKELPELELLHKKLEGKGLKVVGVVLDDSPDSVREYVEKYALTYPMLFDSEGGSKRLYQIIGLPESVILDKDGKVVLLPDPRSGNLVTKMMGPRNWNSAEVEALFVKLLER